MDQPDFNAVFAQFAPSLHLVDSERRAERVHEAHDMFALFVQSAITDAQTQSVMLAQQLSDPQAKRFMSYGTGRRFGMIRAAFKSIRGLVPSDRIAPLPIEKVGAVSRDLNVIYINVRGTIDNYAWCLRHERGNAATRALHPTKVDLFSEFFLSDVNFAPIRAKIELFRDWHGDLKQRRDPAAHRIPLSVSPTSPNSAQAEGYSSLGNEINTAIRAGDFQKANALRDQQGSIGTFVPDFSHDPHGAWMPIYPTVPQDIANLLKIERVIREFLSGEKTN